MLLESQLAVVNIPELERTLQFVYLHSSAHYFPAFYCFLFAILNSHQLLIHSIDLRFSVCIYVCH